MSVRQSSLAWSSALLLVLLCGVSAGTKRRKPLERYQKRFLSEPGRMTIQNMTCDFVQQPLNHFALPKGSSPTYMQRYCYYDKYVVDPSNATVFLYTGNESPLEAYINATGLMWELAESFQAQIVFVEHRYEGKSLPSPDIDNCMAYASSIQAIADYAHFVEYVLFRANKDTATMTRRPVIAFGGSYGGMLSAWMRMKYPNLIAGAVAASAPIWGFPRNFPDKISAAWSVIQRGLELPYPPTADAKTEEVHHCVPNMMASWPLIKLLGSPDNEVGRDVLTDVFRLCQPLRDARALIEWAQSPWFDFGEGSFPYPSGYIPFALTHNDKVKLPAWPLQAACWTESNLHMDHGIVFEGQLSDVRYNITFEDMGFRIIVDWDNATAVLVGGAEDGKEITDWTSVLRRGSDNGSLRGPAAVLTSLRDAVSVWFNMTKDVQCYNLEEAPNVRSTKPQFPITDAVDLLADSRRPQLRQHETENTTARCEDAMKEGSWGAICCNEEMRLIITEAQGLGSDYLWPPSHERGTHTHADVIVNVNWTDAYCADPEGIFGYPQEAPDPWSTWFDIVYGGINIVSSHSNIVFSNGLLDPWSAAGVYKTDPTIARSTTRTQTDYSGQVPGLEIQEINDKGMVAVIMAYGGHHTDLMYRNATADPPSITAARDFESQQMVKWVQEFWAGEMGQ